MESGLSASYKIGLTTDNQPGQAEREKPTQLGNPAMLGAMGPPCYLISKAGSLKALCKAE